MSHRQFGTLRYIRSYDIQTDIVRQFNLTTLGSLLQRGWIERSGTRVSLTDAGEKAFIEYHRATANLRKNGQAEISERVSLMLNLRSLRGKTA